MKLLFVNACVNRATSRTLKLARGVIEAMQTQEPFEVTEIVLEEEKLAPLTTESLNARQALEQKGNSTMGYFPTPVSSAMPTGSLLRPPFGLPATQPR